MESIASQPESNWCATDPVRKIFVLFSGCYWLSGIIGDGWKRIGWQRYRPVRSEGFRKDWKMAAFPW